jgi:hypothetical protein
LIDAIATSTATEELDVADAKEGGSDAASDGALLLQYVKIWDRGGDVCERQK